MSTIEVGKVSFKINNVTNGVDVGHQIFNAGEKSIKYLTFGYIPYNSVGDVVGCMVGKSKQPEVYAKLTGPLEPKADSSVDWEALWYNPTVAKVVITKVVIIFMDDTEETISGKDLVNMYDDKSVYNKEIGRFTKGHYALSSGKYYSDFLNALKPFENDKEEDVLKLFKGQRISGEYGYDLGDAIAKCFPNSKELMLKAVEYWKNAIVYQQTYYNTSWARENKGYPAKYAEKIKKYEPTYEIPKKAGCVTLG